MQASGAVGRIRWAAIGLPLAGEAVSGDLHVVTAIANGALLAVIDGLGHGPHAARAAQTAAAALTASPERSVADHVAACHAEMADTRGAVMAVVQLRGDRLHWVGVGNVQAVLCGGAGAGSTRLRLGQVGGVVGHKIPALRAQALEVSGGELLLLCTDGLRADFADALDTWASPEHVAHQAFTRGLAGNDDALVLAARIDRAAS